MIIATFSPHTFNPNILLEVIICIHVCTHILGVCQRLHNPKNGKVKLSKLFKGSYANFSCDSGYELLGSPALVCMSSGLWDLAPPICYSKQLCTYVTQVLLHGYIIEPCGNPATINNGEVIISGRTPGSDATYVCNDHYQLIGNAMIICQSDSHWLGEVPKCKSTYLCMLLIIFASKFHINRYVHNIIAFECSYIII